MKSLKEFNDTIVTFNPHTHTKNIISHYNAKCVEFRIDVFFKYLVYPFSNNLSIHHKDLAQQMLR